jgi:hypothetical protein
MKPRIRHRVPDLMRQVDVVPQVGNEALRRGLNATVRKGPPAVQSVMRRVFDRVTPYALNAMRVQEAQGQGTQLKAGVMIKGAQDIAGSAVPPQSFLRAQILGGTRRWKRFEVALMRAGLLPRGWYVVPGQGARLDAYGNMSAGHVVQLMAYLQLFKAQSSGRRQNMSDKRRQQLGRSTRRRRGVEYFVQLANVAGPGGRRDLAPGIWERADFGAAGKGIRPVVLFVRTNRYRPRLDYFGTLQRHAAAVMPTEIERAVALVRRTHHLRDVR